MVSKKNDKKHRKVRALFITKKNNNSYGMSLGLVNSAKFVANALRKNGYDAEVVTVFDNNDIDREVTRYRPDYVFIEALWVVPEKFDVLKRRHPNVVWVVRIHSKVPYLSNEGIAIEWIKQCLERDIIVAANNEEPFNSLSDVLNTPDVFFDTEMAYLPNVYDPPRYNHPDRKGDGNSDILNIGCFGAIRPLKNQLQQGLAAMRYANETSRVLRFHVNAGRVERGESALRNLIYLFDGTPHELVQHGWYSHEEFSRVVRKMDIGMQVSFSESFNIVAADFVANNVPVVVSPEIEWVSSLFHADPNSNDNIVKVLRRAEWFGKVGQRLNKKGLQRISDRNLDVWLKFLG